MLPPHCLAEGALADAHATQSALTFPCAKSYLQGGGGSMRRRPRFGRLKRLEWAVPNIRDGDAFTLSPRHLSPKWVEQSVPLG